MSSNQLRRWFASPYFPDDPDKTRVARVLNVMILSFMAVSASAWFIGTVLLSGQPATASFGMASIGFLIMLIGLRRGHVHGISKVLIVSILLFGFIGNIRAVRPFSIGVVASMVAVFAASVIFNREQVIKVILANTLIAVVGYVYWAFITSKPTNQIYLILDAFLYAGYSFAVGVVTLVTVSELRRTLQTAAAARADLAQRNHELSHLLGVMNTVSSTLKQDELLNLILSQLRDVVPYDRIAMLAFDTPTTFESLSFGGKHNNINPLIAWTYDPIQDIHLRDMIAHRKPVIIDDLNADTPYANAMRQRFQRHNASVDPVLTASMYVPLVMQDRVLGMMALHSATPAFYNERYASLALAFANQAAVAWENARLHEKQVQSAALAERARLARELHDSVSQALFGIVLGARTLEQRLPAHSEMSEATAYVLQLSEAALAEIRALIFELHPESLEKEGLIVALSKQAASLCQRHKIDVQLNLGEVEPAIAVSAKEVLYRIGMEAIQNTVKHAKATRVDMQLKVDPNGVCLEIKDNGQGFDPTASYDGHYGLRSMRERAIQYGATLNLSSQRGQGTLVCVRLPT